MWHWKIPGYAALYLPIYEAHFGELTTAQYDAALAAGTPAGGAMPAYYGAASETFWTNGGGTDDATPLPEPVSCTTLLVSAALLTRRRSQRR